MKDYINTTSTTSEAHNYYEQGYRQGRADVLKNCTLENGEYCWQRCSAYEHCHECKWLGNGDIIYFEQLKEKN